MPYVVRRDEVYIHHHEGVAINAAQEVVGEERVSVRHRAGDVIADGDLANSVKENLKRGDAHTVDLLEYYEDESAAKARAEQLVNPQAAALGVPAGAYHAGGASAVDTDVAAAMGALGPAPLEVGPTGLSAAPGVVAPDQAATLAEQERLAPPAKSEAKDEPKGGGARASRPGGND